MPTKSHLHRRELRSKGRDREIKREKEEREEDNSIWVQDSVIGTNRNILPKSE